MIKTVFLISLFFIPAFGQLEFGTDLINKPPISTRCAALLKKRDDKIIKKNKLIVLQKRTKRILKEVDSNRQTIVARLKKSEIQVKNELRFTRMRVQKMEEHIIRQGCPGIRF